VDRLNITMKNFSPETGTSMPRFEHEIFRMQDRHANHSNSVFDLDRRKYNLNLLCIG
jgi:hypothetical protein